MLNLSYEYMGIHCTLLSTLLHIYEIVDDNKWYRDHKLTDKILSNICTNLRVQLKWLVSLIIEFYCIMSKNNDILQIVGLILQSSFICVISWWHISTVVITSFWYCLISCLSHCPEIWISCKSSSIFKSNSNLLSHLELDSMLKMIMVGTACIRAIHIFCSLCIKSKGIIFRLIHTTSDSIIVSWKPYLLTVAWNMDMKIAIFLLHWQYW